MESQFKMFRMTDGANVSRKNVQAIAEDYMRKAAPEKYHNILIPDFELGCKVGALNPWLILHSLTLISSSVGLLIAVAI